MEQFGAVKALILLLKNPEQSNEVPHFIFAGIYFLANIQTLTTLT